LDVVKYAFFSYGLTAIISLVVMGIIVVISKSFGNSNEQKEI